MGRPDPAGVTGAALGLRSGAGIRYETVGAGVRLATAGPEGGAPSVVLLPCAGGGAGSFRTLTPLLPAGWRTVAVDPPRRGVGAAPPLPDVAAMVNAYADALARIVEGPYVLVGHSFGGLLAFLLAQRFERVGRAPAGVFVCAIGPGGLGDRSWSSLPDEALVARLADIGGVPEPFVRDPAVFRAFLEPIRSDLRALETYDRRNGLGTVRAPLYAVAAEDDRLVGREQVREWTRHGAEASFRVLPGGHFFPRTHAAPFARWLAAEVERRTAGRGSAAPAEPRADARACVLRRDAPPVPEQPPPALALGGGEVHVWYVEGEVRDPSLLAAYRGLLSPAEREQIDRIRIESVRRERLVARALVRTVLSRYVACAPGAWEFERDACGRPVVAGDAAALRFSLSHTPGLVTVAVARRRDVGIDAEDAGRGLPGTRIAEHCFAAAEIDALRGLPESACTARFLELWTLKEAYAKASGVPLFTAIEHAAFRVEPGGRVEARFGPPIAEAPSRWQFALRRLPAHVVALAIRRGDEPDLAVRARRILPLVSEENA